MANIKISELNLAEDLNNSYIPGIKENTSGNFDSKKFSLDNFQNSIDTNSNSILYGIDEFSNNKSYYKGEYILYDNNIYKFIEFHSPGEWISTDVARISVFSELGLLNEFNNETLNIHLGSSDNNLNTFGIIVTVTYNNTNLQESCDSNGNCSFNIPKNSEYTISIPFKEGYQEVENITGIANTSTKNINIVYQKNIPSTCNLKLYFTISSLTEEINQEEYINDLNDFTVTLTSSLNNETVNINNGVAIFNNINTNTEYTISFPDVQGYIKPNNKNFITYSDSELTSIYKKVQHYNNYGVYLVVSIENEDYEIKIEDLYDNNDIWVGEISINGENYQISNTNVKAIHICPETLATKGCDYFVKIEDLTIPFDNKIKSTFSNPDNTQLDYLTAMTSNLTYENQSYPDGKLYTYYLYMNLPKFNNGSSTLIAEKVLEKKLTYNEKTLDGFLGSSYQYGFLLTYTTDIDKLLENLELTSNFKPTSTNVYWSSNVYNLTQAIACGDSVSNKNKNSSLNILPLYS